MFYAVDWDEIRRMRDPLQAGRAIGYLLSAYPFELVLKKGLETAAEIDWGRAEDVIGKATKAELTDSEFRELLESATAVIAVNEVDRKRNAGMMTMLKVKNDVNPESKLYRFTVGVLQGWFKGQKPNLDEKTPQEAVLEDLVPKLDSYLYSIPEEEAMQMPEKKEEIAFERVVLAHKRGEIDRLSSAIKEDAVKYMLKTGDPHVVYRYAKVKSITVDPHSKKPFIGFDDETVKRSFGL
ncbi:hypothetical protein [Persephonella sp.]